MTSVLLFFICFSSVFSQIMEQSVSPDDIARSMEANLTFDLQNELCNYFPQNKIAIKANIRLYRISPEPVNPSRPALPDLEDKTVLPGLPRTPEAPAHARSQYDAQQMTRMLQQYLQESGYRISRISINAIVDSSLNRDEILFIRKLVTLRAGINPNRGDRVTIEVLNFPLNQKKSISPILEEHATTNEDEFANKSNLIMWSTFALALLIAAVISYLIYRHHKQLATQRGQPTHLNQGITPNKQVSNKKKSAQLNNPPVTEYLIGAPGASAKVFQSWINDLNTKGIEKTAVLLKHISPELIEMYKPHLSHENCVKIRSMMNKINRPIPQNIIAEIHRKFDHDFKLLTLKSSTSKNEEELFSFIFQLTDDQLIHLMKDVEPGFAAIIIAQLQPERGAALLKKFEKDVQKEIFLALSKIEKIPLKMYRAVARRLANKAQKVANMKYVTADVVDATVNLLDQFDENAQRDILNHLKCNDLKFAGRVHKKFIKFSDVIQLPNPELREIFRTADREVIAASIVDLNDTDIERIISALPVKMGEMVRSSLNMKKFAPESEIEEAKRRLVRTARNRSTKGNRMSGAGKNIKGMPQIIMDD